MRILVVEDEPDMQFVVAAALREEGYAVDTADDGEEGLFKATTSEYDLVALDVMLPRMDGWTVLKRLRTERQTPVLMLTARDQITDRVRGLDGGADDYLVKPFELAEFLARVRALIRRSAGQSQPVIEIGDIRIDLAPKAVTRQGEPVALTAKEYSLIEFLAIHRGELVTRTRLYDHLFDETDDSLSNLIDVYISNLRRKLGHELIVTRRGQGYLIPADDGAA
jgi:two-component system OmpR family response regulator